MIAGVLSIGDEVLIGKVTNTNSQYISKKLSDIGIKVKYHVTIPDEEDSIIGALSDLRSKVDVIFCTGGLGVTDDDISKKVITRYFNRELVTSDIARNDVLNYYTSRGINIPPIAMGFMALPNKSKYLVNNVGIAPGAIIEEEDVKVVLLPGPPREMRPMADVAINYLTSFMKLEYGTMYLKTFGIKEADVFTTIKPVIDKYAKSLIITTYCEELEVTVAVRYSSKIPKMTVDGALHELTKLLNKHIYACKDTNLQTLFSELCKVRGVKIAVAESLTGGTISSRLIDIPGASEFFHEGIVCYDNLSKMNRLDVSDETLEDFGAVSEEVAYEMAMGLLESSDVDVAIATTGIAGPDGGTAEKPAGLVYIAIGTRDAIHIYKRQFFGNRADIIDMTTKTALHLAIATIK